MFGIKPEDDSTSYDNTDKTFAGVNFVIRGFDLVSEKKVRSKLVSSGGVDVGQYGPICTHVIVHKLVNDDPICIAARADGKVLVTGMWVDHSFDVGMPVDPNSVMYRPLQGKDGIPGSESLIVCLTGYQRQDRDDIMTMVGLMGAKFLKPLVANKVTHLICYKFEGEKYELAKKMNRIKLVNHRWLEDCLKAWTILPEADYNKSGYELEMMEAEAKDSEEEDAVQEPSTKQSEGRKNVARPNNLTASERITLQSKEFFSKSLPTSSAYDSSLHHTATSDATASASREESLSVKASSIQDTDRRNTNIVGFLDHINLQDFTCNEPYLKNPISTKGASNLGAHSDVSKSSSVCNLRKTAGENTPSTVNINDGFEVYLSREEQPKVGAECGPVRSNPKEKRSSLSGKRKLDLSYGKSKLPKISCCLEMSNSGSPSVSNVITGSVSAISINASVDKNASLTSIYTCPVNKANASPRSRCTSPVNMVKENISGKSLSKSDLKLDKPRPFPVESKNMGLSTEHGNDDIVADAKFVSIESVKSQRQQQEPPDPSPKAKTPGLDKSSSRKLDILKGKDDDSIAKRKNLESRPKVGLGKANIQKDSIYLSDDASASMIDSNVSEKAEKLSLNFSSDKGMAIETNKVVNPENGHVDKMGYMDDETKPPEDKHEDQFQAASGERAEETNKVNLAMKGTLECTIPSTTRVDNKAEDSPYADEVGPKSENEVSGGKSGLDEPTTSKGYVVEKSNKSLGRRKLIQTVPGKRISKEGASREDSETKNKNQKMGLNKEKSSPSPIAKTERTAPLGNTDTSTEVGKENIPTGKTKSVLLVPGMRQSKEQVSREEPENKKEIRKMGNKEKSSPSPIATERTVSLENADASTEVGKENSPTDKTKAVPLVSGKRKSKEKKASKEEPENKNKNSKMRNKEKSSPSSIATERTAPLESAETSTEVRKENSPTGNTKSVSLVPGKRKSKEKVSREEPENKKINLKIELIKEKCSPTPKANTSRRPPSKKAESSIELGKENRPSDIGDPNVGQRIVKAASKFKNTQTKVISRDVVSDQGSVLRALNMIREPSWFLLTGHKLQRKELQQVIKRLRGRVCRDSHKWSYQATHLICPDPLRRTEKFFAAAASGRWILKTDYLAACNQEGKFLAEEHYEWHKKGLSEDGAISLEAPRKWRFLRERTGHGALYGMRVIIYGECIAPSLDTLKRVIKAGDGTILATSPPYTRFLNSGVDYAIVSPGMPCVDKWVQEFFRHEIPCVVADYLVEYVCKPGYPLERHVQYNTQPWAERSFASLQHRSQEVVLDKETPEADVIEILTCQICSSRERYEEMLICGDESGSLGCGVGTHIDCCNPPLVSVPDEDWFCAKCSKSKKSKDCSKSTKKGRPSKGK